MKIIQLKKNNLELLDEAAALFNSYREFYEQNSDETAAKNFLLERINNDESEIFLALNDENKAVGFMQLYRSFSSVALKRIYILNDLFVASDARGLGVGKALLDAAKNFAAKNGINKISLTTAINNLKAQHLYEKEGFRKNEEYWVYNFLIE